MKTAEKTTLVIALVLVLFCVISFAVLFFTDFWVAPLKSTAAVSAASRNLIALDAQFPFKPPQGAGIPKERLEPFLAASCRTKATADPLEAWLEENGQVQVGGQTVYSKDGAALMIAYLRDLTAALPEAKMGPEEFDWIHEHLRLVAKGPPSEHKRQEIRAEIDSLRRLAEDPKIGAQRRAHLMRDVAAFEAAPEAWGPPFQADWALYQANAERIKACVHGRHAVRAVGRFLVHASGEHGIRVEFDPDDAPPSPPEPPALPPPPPPSH